MSQSDTFTHMSDDDFEKFLESGEQPVSAEEPLTEASSVSDTQESEETTDEPIQQEEATDAGEQEAAEFSEEEAQPEEETSKDVDSGESTGTEDKGETESSGFTPIKVKVGSNEIEVRSLEEQQQLMQKGLEAINSQGDITKLRQTSKTLESNEISQEDLNLLIDAHKGDKGAIAKLIQKHSIDTMDLDDAGSDYTPTDHTVSNTQVQLDEVISRIEGTAAFTRTSDVVSKQWDKASKQEIFGKPHLLETLNNHIANGTFDRVMSEVNRAKVFGGLSGMSDLEAYQRVGEELQKQNVFGQQQQTQAPATVTTAPKPKKEANTEQRRRAAPTRRTPQQAKQPVDYSRMSDAEFEKLLNSN